MIVLHDIRNTSNTLPSDSVIPTPYGMKPISSLENDNIKYIYGNDGNPIKYKSITLLDNYYDTYEVSFKNKMNIVTSATQQFPVFSSYIPDVRRMSVEEMMKQGPITPDGVYLFNIPTSPKLEKFPIKESDGSVNSRMNILDRLFGYDKETGFGDLITTSKSEVYLAGLVAQSLGYKFSVESKRKSYTCNITTNIFMDKITTVSGIRKLDVSSKMIGITIDNKDNMFIGPNMTLMYGYTI